MFDLILEKDGREVGVVLSEMLFVDVETNEIIEEGGDLGDFL